MGTPSDDITQYLGRFTRGDADARDHLLPLVYDELRKIAGAHLRRERTDNSLQPTALVHEAYLKLVGMDRMEWRDRVHFFALSSRLMRQILVDKSRRDSAEKRGGGVTVLAINEVMGAQTRPVDMIALDDALHALARVDERKARVVEMRFFGGLSEEEIGTVLDISARTVKRDWQMARAWLYDALSA